MTSIHPESGDCGIGGIRGGREDEVRCGSGRGRRQHDRAGDDMAGRLAQEVT